MFKKKSCYDVFLFRLSMLQRQVFWFVVVVFVMPSVSWCGVFNHNINFILRKGIQNDEHLTDEHICRNLK